MLAMRIVRGSYNALPAMYSQQLKSLVPQLLAIEAEKRPNINILLKHPLISSRIKKFLDEEDFKSEFNHTILHKQNVFNKT